MKRIIVAALLAGTALSANASSNIETVQNLSQSDFRLFSEDLASALSYKALSPAEPLGITGLDVSLEVTATKLQHPELFQAAANNSSMSTLPVAKLHVQKGLPFGIDLGAFYSSVPNTNIKLYGGEVRYALVSGNVAIPAVAIRGTYTKLTGVDQLDLSTRGLELSVSKGIAMFTPYAGVGKVWASSAASLPAPYSLGKENFSLNKYFVGANLTFLPMVVGLEADKTGDATSYGLKLGIRW